MSCRSSFLPMRTLTAEFIKLSPLSQIPYDKDGQDAHNPRPSLPVKDFEINSSCNAFTVPLDTDVKEEAQTNQNSRTGRTRHGRLSIEDV